MNTSTGAGEEDKKQRARERAADEVIERRLARMKDAGADASERIARYVRKSPVAAVGIAAGAGFVVGSLFGTRIGRFLLVLGAGYAAQDLVDGALGEGGLRKLVSDEIARVGRSKS
jgi:hypothetical protein